MYIIICVNSLLVKKKQKIIENVLSYTSNTIENNS